MNNGKNKRVVKGRELSVVIPLAKLSLSDLDGPSSSAPSALETGGGKFALRPLQDSTKKRTQFTNFVDSNPQ